MKRTTTILAALTLTIGVAFANGNEKEGTKASSKVSKTALHKWDHATHRLFYTSNEAGEVEINIKNQKGKVIQSFSVDNEDGFTIPLNTSQLKFDNYVIEIII